MSTVFVGFEDSMVRLVFTTGRSLTTEGVPRLVDHHVSNRLDNGSYRPCGPYLSKERRYPRAQKAGRSCSRRGQAKTVRPSRYCGSLSVPIQQQGSDRSGLVGMECVVRCGAFLRQSPTRMGHEEPKCLFREKSIRP